MSALRRIRLLALLAVTPGVALAQATDAEAGDAVALGDDAGAIWGGGTEAEPAEHTPDPVAMAYFKETLERYRDRMTEFRKEAKGIVDAQEAIARTDLQEGYAGQLAKLDVDAEELRAEAIKRFEAFLAKYPDTQYTAHVMFRLGDLYFEEAEEDFELADREYSRMMNSLDSSNLEAMTAEPPKKDYAKSLRLYRRIVERYPDYQYVDGAYYMMGYCLSRDDAEQFDEDASRDMFQALVDKYPGSQFAAVAHLRLGEYYFDFNQLDEAIGHYEKVVELQGKDGSLYDEGLYKLAWSYYKKSDYDQALGLLTDLLDWSDDQLTQTGKESAMAPEAIEYSAISFSDVGDKTGQSPVKVAQSFYGTAGHREFEDKVYKRLANVLTQQARYDDAIATYRFIQEQWPDDPKNPDYQWEIGKLYMSMVPQNAAAAQEAVTDLNRKYSDESDWWRANRNNPEALNSARAYIEKSLAAVATSYHTDAIETNNAEEYKKASELYSEYLTKFPFAEDYYEIQWYLADTLIKSGQLEAAERQYEQLLKAGDNTYKDGSLWLLMQVRRQMIIDKYGSFDKRPDDAVEESRVTLADSKQRVVYSLSDEHKKFIEVCDQLTEADIKSPEYAEALDQYRVALAYIPAQILYWHGHFDEARPRLEQIVEKWHYSEEAEFAASLIVRSYQDEDDLANVRKYSGIYRRNPPGPPNDVKSDNLKFGTIEEGATFKLAEQHIAEGDRLAAAKAFESFMAEFPGSKFVMDAHYNAANSYEIIGRVEDANRLFEKYIQNIEKGIYKEEAGDERSRALYFRIASNYGNVLDLDQAIYYYEAMVRRFPDYDDSPAALYNAAFLRIGNGDFAGAGTNLEKYATSYPEQLDAEQVFFQAGEQWERVSPDKGIDFYRRYVKRYGDANPDHVMEAYYRIATLTEKNGRERDIDRAWDDLWTTFNRLLAANAEIGAAGRHYAAGAEFRQIEKQWAEFTQIKFTNNDDKNADLLINVKLNQLNALQDRCLNLITSFQDFEYSSGALHIQGMAFYRYSDMLYDAPPPKGLDEESLMFYQEALDEKRLPVEEKGRNRLEANLELAKKESRWSEWTTKTLAELARRLPLEYSEEKVELRGSGDSNLVPTAGPISLREKKAEEGEEQAP